MNTTILPDRYYRAVQDPIEGWEATGNYTDTRNIKVVWHKTVGTNYPRSTYVAGGGIPHFTITRDGTVYQHYSLNQFSRALRNLWGGVQTNLDGAIQIEMVGHPGAGSTRAQRKSMKQLSRWFNKKGVAGRWINGAPTFVKYKRVGQKKLSNAGWDNGSGHCGHIDIPENDHWDPAFLDSEVAAIERGWESPWSIIKRLRARIRANG